MLCPSAELALKVGAVKFVQIRESMDFLSTSAQDVVELRSGQTVDLTQTPQLAKSSGKVTAHHTNDQRTATDQPIQNFGVTCFVCGSVGRFQLFSIRIRQNPARPSEPYFPFFASHHEPPAGFPPILHNQTKLQACSMCQQILHEQW